jgi:hypothetical protein
MLLLRCVRLEVRPRRPGTTVSLPKLTCATASFAPQMTCFHAMPSISTPPLVKGRIIPRCALFCAVVPERITATHDIRQIRLVLSLRDRTPSKPEVSRDVGIHRGFSAFLRSSRSLLSSSELFRSS